jgi:hypothetical protein
MMFWMYEIQRSVDFHNSRKLLFQISENGWREVKRADFAKNLKLIPKLMISIHYTDD